VVAKSISNSSFFLRNGKITKKSNWIWEKTINNWITWNLITKTNQLMWGEKHNAQHLEHEA
jgi:hypothetical protein